MKQANIFTNLYNLSDEIRQVVEKEFLSHDFKISYEHDEDADFNVVIGGDGTFIKAVHESNFSNVPFIGINTGKLGFYNDIKPDDVESAIERLKDKKYILNELKVIECHIESKNGDFIYKSINEIVIKSKSTSIIKFDLYVDDMRLQKFAGDGMIFSTPSGSTAYNLSSGGSIVYQNIDAFQITPLAPIKSSIYKSLDKSVVVPKNTKIKLVTEDLNDDEFLIGIDGIECNHTDIKSINIQLSKDSINKIVFDEKWFWKNIRDKFI